jgi:copper oxidase (laccase) domain-containing protein
VAAPGDHAGVDADAAWTDVPGAKLAIRTADCVPIVLHGDDRVAVVHAGWRGLAAGVIEETIEAMGGAILAHIGPHIRAGCYEFGQDELDQVAAALGAHVRATTVWGTPALDLTAGVRAALDGVRIHDSCHCTACMDTWYSWRARRETERFATTAWLEP